MAESRIRDVVVGDLLVLTHDGLLPASLLHGELLTRRPTLSIHRGSPVCTEDSLV